jgi:molecular chaperone DnaK
MGAALLADSFDKIDSVVLLDALSIPIGIGLPGGRFKPIIPKNTRIPFEKTYQLTTTKDEQTVLDIDVFQGDAENVTDCEYLGTFVLGDIPKAQKGASKITLTFKLDIECILNLQATESLSGKTYEAQMVVRETPESVKKQFEREKTE